MSTQLPIRTEGPSGTLVRFKKLIFGAGLSIAVVAGVATLTVNTQPLNFGTYTNASPTTGDVWRDGDSLNFRQAAATVDLAAAGGGSGDLTAVLVGSEPGRLSVASSGGPEPIISMADRIDVVGVDADTMTGTTVTITTGYISGVSYSTSGTDHHIRPLDVSGNGHGLLVQSGASTNSANGGGGLDLRGAASGTGGGGWLRLWGGDNNSASNNAGDVELRAGKNSGAGDDGKVFVNATAGTAFKLPNIAGAATRLENGDMWYDSSATYLKGRENSTTVALGQTPWRQAVDAATYGLSNLGNTEVDGDLTINSGTIFAVSAITGASAITLSHSVYLASGDNYTVTIADADANPGASFVIKDIGGSISFGITLQPDGDDLIDSASNKTITASYSGWRFIAYNGDWWSIAKADNM